MNDFRQKQHKIFYGWWIVGACLLIGGYISGITQFGFTAAFEPIVNEFGWSYAQVAFAGSLCTVLATLLTPLAGLLVDRWGARRLIFAGITITGLGLLLLSRISSVETFYGACILIAVGTCGCMDIPQATAVVNWFRKRVAIATGILTSGAAIGGLLVPLVTRIIDIFDWRTAMVIFGLGAWVILLPLSLLVRHKPEQYGYLPDGDMSSMSIADEGQTTAQDTEEDVGVKQALKSSAFWHIALGLTCHICVVYSVNIHVMPYLSSIGINRMTSSLVASAIPIMSIGGRLSFGWFGDRFEKRRVTAVGFAMLGLSMLCFGYAATEGAWLLIPFLICFGIGYGGPIPMIYALMREYFGRVRFGTILGLAMSGASIISMLGTPLAGWVFDTYGSYQGIWLAFAGLAIAGMISLLTTHTSHDT